jgi:hypothetical protein
MKARNGLGRLQPLVLASALALAIATFAGPATAFARADPGPTVWQAGGSNMGECSAYLGGMQARDDVNRIIQEYGDVLGISNPGELFRVRAQQPVSLPPAQECLQRALP